MSVLYYWPTLLWLIGSFEFIVQTAVGPTSRTSYFSGILSALFLGGFLVKQRRPLRAAWATEWGALKAGPKALWFLIVLQAVIFTLGLLEARLPPHLVQETDALGYHMGLTRQHLLTGSLGHISWSAADLWPLPLQWGMAPYWFSGAVFQKLPQWIFSFWAFMLLTQIGKGSTAIRWTVACAIFTTHGVVIQLGTAMFDLPILYCLIASLHAMQRVSAAGTGVHVALFAATKAFMPLQTIAVALPLWAGTMIFDRKNLERYRPFLKKSAGVAALCFTIFIARSAAVSLGRAGTPLFPFATCALSVKGCEGEEGVIIRESAAHQAMTRDAYGLGRGPLPLLQHVWKVAVPTRGVNNEYDYPLGLSWLLLIVLGIGACAWRKTLAFAASEKRTAFTALLFWSIWWMGSQQSRWLYPVLTLGWLSLRPVIERGRLSILTGVLGLAALVSLVSQYRSYTSQLWENRDALQSRMEQGLTDPTKFLYEDKVIEDMPRGERLWILR